MTKVFTYTNMFTSLATVILLAVIPAAVMGVAIASV